jgi:hypothetical protein
MDQSLKVSQNDLEKLNNLEQGNNKRPEFVPKIDTLKISNQNSLQVPKTLDLSSP